MIQPSQIAFDIDGVIADTMQLFLEIAGKVHGINHIRYTDITDYNLYECLDIDPDIIDDILNRIMHGQYSCRLHAIDGAGDVLRRLGEHCPIRLITARSKPGPIPYWIDDMLPREHFEVMLETTGDHKAKADVLDDLNVRYFVEDRLDTCFLLRDRRVTPIVFAQPWNRQPHPFTEVTDWPQLEKLIQFN
ncbi:MAG: haloacid dehalogenase [Desulfobacteraceae bacterium]|nr:haloacid dehalogenase [Desulfobacteraceae bacterium]